MAPMKKGALLGVAVLSAACATVDGIAVRSSRRVLERGLPSTREEPDYDLARAAMPAQIKLVEGLIASAPRDRELRRMAAEGLAGGSFLFVEDESPARAKAL